MENIDIYEDKKCFVCLLDYEFSEIRWDVNTKAENPDSMTGEEIKNKFHLLNKQIKQKKEKFVGNVIKQEREVLHLVYIIFIKEMKIGIVKYQ